MNPVLEEMFATGEVSDGNGHAHQFHSGVTRHQAEVLEAICRRERPSTTLEVGLAYGSSTIAILEGKSSDKGMHYAIDPFQSSEWGMLGVENVRRAGFASRFTLFEEYDDLALPRLVSDSLRIDFAFIDGDHSLSASWLDWHYLDQLLVDGGLIVFHDYPLGGPYYTVAIALRTGRYERVTDWDLHRPWRRRMGSAAIKFVDARLKPGPAFAHAAANSQMAVLRKRASYVDVGDLHRP